MFGQPPPLPNRSHYRTFTAAYEVRREVMFSVCSNLGGGTPSPSHNTSTGPMSFLGSTPVTGPRSQTGGTWDRVPPWPGQDGIPPGQATLGQVMPRAVSPLRFPVGGLSSVKCFAGLWKCTEFFIHRILWNFYSISGFCRTFFYKILGFYRIFQTRRRGAFCHVGGNFLSRGVLRMLQGYKNSFYILHALPFSLKRRPKRPYFIEIIYSKPANTTDDVSCEGQIKVRLGKNYNKNNQK